MAKLAFIIAVLKGSNNRTLLMNVLKPIIYFSLFNHPLTEEEVFRFSKSGSKSSLQSDINELIELGVIDKVDDFLLYKKEPKHISKRLEGNKNAAAVMPKAKKVAAFIASFPFVEGVSISGSLSKGYYDIESDFDFFIVTKTKRVWFTRTLIALYKRVFLLNSHKEFCVNYFVSCETLEIEEKNRFTATEIVTLIPLFGRKIFTKFYQKNNWVVNFFPNYDFNSNIKNTTELKKPLLARLLQFLFDNFLGTAINYVCMRLITKKWQWKYDRHKKEAYKAKKEISKHHPENFQNVVITNLNSQYKSCYEKYGIEIKKEHV